MFNMEKRYRNKIIIIIIITTDSFGGALHTLTVLGGALNTLTQF